MNALSIRSDGLRLTDVELIPLRRSDVRCFPAMWMTVASDRVLHRIPV